VARPSNTHPQRKQAVAMVKALVSPHVGAQEAATEVAEELGLHLNTVRRWYGQDVPPEERPQRARKNPPKPKPVPGRKPGRPPGSGGFGFGVSKEALAKREAEVLEIRCTHCRFRSGDLPLREARAAFNVHRARCPRAHSAAAS